MGKVYKKNFLGQVVLRIDFEPIDLSNFSIYQEKLKPKFGKCEAQQILTGTIEFKSDGETTQSTQQSTESVWVFSDEKTSRKLEISTSYLVLNYSNYANSEKLREDVKSVFQILKQEANLNTAIRVGLRYINQISIPSVRKIGDWQRYIAKELLETPLYLQKSNSQTRIFSVSEFNNDSNIATGFRFGLWNEQYPSPITSTPYIIDIDCFTRQPSDLNELSIESVVEQLNIYSEDTFEKSITDNLRKIMGEYE